MLRRRLLATALAIPLLAAKASYGETVELKPDERASWGLKNLFAPIGAIFLGPAYWYDERRVEVETSPSGATLDLFYVRASFQKRFEQATAPAVVVLPSRVEAGPRDAVTIRASLEGHKFKEVTLPMSDRTEKVVIDLDPLPNTLKAVSSSTFGARTSLSFLTKEAPTARLQQRPEGFTLMLTETALGGDVDRVLPTIRGGAIASVAVQPLGEDLMVRVDLTPDARARGMELRSRVADDPARDLHEFVIDVVPPGGSGGEVERARAALARVEPRDVTGCALVFDDALRKALDPESLARALSPRGDFTDPYLRAAMKRLGEVSPGGEIAMLDGSRFRPDSPLELTAAVTEASQARGFLALLRSVTEHSEPGAGGVDALRSLVAPESGADAFAASLGRAEAAERACRGGTRGG